MNLHLKIVLILFSVLLRPNKILLKIIKLLYRGSAVSTVCFLICKIPPLVPGATSEVLQGLAPWPMVVITLSYLVLIYAGSLMCWQVADNCTIQLKNRFNADP